MPDDTYIQNALVSTFRRRRTSGVLTDLQLEAFVDQALAELTAGTTVIKVAFEGGSTDGAINCSPAVLLAAAEQVLAEFAAGATNGTGLLDLDLSRSRIET